jgi:osmotically-inducible protein OsmY
MARDETLQTRLLEDLGWDPRIDATKVSVDVTAGAAVLTGSIPTYAEKCRCAEVVKHVPGVTGVRNELEVRLTIRDYRPDATLQRVADEMLQCLALLPQEYPHATVANGWITLNGDVSWEFQKRLAEDAVAKIAGVRGIVNRIRVLPRIRPRADLKRIIETVLRRRMPKIPIEISADGGRITLAGAVASCAERDELLDLAWSTPGVIAVEDHIDIQPAI